MDNYDLIDKLYQQMKENKNLVGTFEKADSEIIWSLYDKFTVIITYDYIGIQNKLFGIIPNCITHWHPYEDDIYDDICSLGTKGNVTVIHSTPLCTGIIYSGPAENCKIKRKWLFGRYYYLYAR